MLRLEQDPSPRDQSFGERTRSVEDEVRKATPMVAHQPTADVKHLTYQAHYPPPFSRRDVGGKPMARPHHRVVCQGIALDHHLWRGTALRIAFGHPQAVLIAFDGDVHPTPALVVEGDRGQQDGSRTCRRSSGCWVSALTAGGDRVAINTP